MTANSAAGQFGPRLFLYAGQKRSNAAQLAWMRSGARSIIARMSDREPIEPRQPARAPDAFHTTRWSVVLSAGQRAEPAAGAALAALCQSYWFPLYAYVR